MGENLFVNHYTLRKARNYSME